MSYSSAEFTWQGQYHLLPTGVSDPIEKGVCLFISSLNWDTQSETVVASVLP